MTEDKWGDLFDEDDLPMLLTNVEQAKRLGKERYGGAFMETIDCALSEPGFSAVLTALVVGNLAFQTQAACSIEITDKHRLVVAIEEIE